MQYKAATGDKKYDKEIEQGLGKLFPNGFAKATLADFKQRPDQGVALDDNRDLLRAAGLKRGEVSWVG